MTDQSYTHESIIRKHGLTVLAFYEHIRFLQSVTTFIRKDIAVIMKCELFACLMCICNLCVQVRLMRVIC